MSNLSPLFDASAGNAWVFIPTAILLGALHGLEPGHSKTMMAAFIVAVRGTVGQAALLGLAATISHSAIVWLVALIGMSLGAQINVEANEPYLQIVSGLMILTVAIWMTWRMSRNSASPAPAHVHGDHGHDDHAHRDHEHADHGHGHGHGDHHHSHDQAHHAHSHSGDHHHHPHGEGAALAARMDEETFESELLSVDPTVYADAHEREHALEIERRFANRKATKGQIILFGLTGGLVPCPASITVLLLCLQAGRFALGATLVLSFSIGLALTLVLVGVAAALGVRHAVSRFPAFEALAARAPYLSSGVVALVGLYTIAMGAKGLA
ncbi:sulfite exporter TauE/SafE family protein [Methylocystis sp. MJC1]|uniref:HoxN/HupN/NixA family nickel/cobalt transporter n=1 Tax=Methylocystis sp. MJC1 TaxID=2654282 RepID=UPI0013E9CEBF|nr:sulfite exporter TauE/SafE family protein [Methylocystis sp. MJC1]KAF2989184.1 Nickel/cobalt efflux system RcnA [Methylocystis sp. MJC1]MBU6525862.1 sulfite exporter TauE/SafE family protein [Methylocystis sp. MJC1]UZX12329.1 sulfite exporter TauE/SafE family protein [Methylocystis sp. MJC1]